MKIRHCIISHLSSPTSIEYREMVMGSDAILQAGSAQLN